MRLALTIFVLTVGALAVSATHPVLVPVQPQPVQVQFPLFTVSGRQSLNDNELLRQLLDEVRQLRQEVAQLRGLDVTAPKNFPGLVVARCAACHKADVAKAKGGDLVLLELDGTLPPFSIDQAAAIVSQVRTGAMPPKGPLSRDEQQLVFDALFRKESP